MRKGQGCEGFCLSVNAEEMLVLFQDHRETQVQRSRMTMVLTPMNRLLNLGSPAPNQTPPSHLEAR
jgi:hypothetical protein